MSAGLRCSKLTAAATIQSRESKLASSWRAAGGVPSPISLLWVLATPAAAAAPHLGCACCACRTASRPQRRGRRPAGAWGRRPLPSTPPRCRVPQTRCEGEGQGVLIMSECWVRLAVCWFQPGGPPKIPARQHHSTLLNRTTELTCRRSRASCRARWAQSTTALAATGCGAELRKAGELAGAASKRTAAG